MSRNGAVLILLALFAGAAGGVASSFALRGAEPTVATPAPRPEEDSAARTSERLERFSEALGEIRLELSALRARIERAEREPARTAPPAPRGTPRDDDGDEDVRPRGEAPPVEIVRRPVEPKDRAPVPGRALSPRAEAIRAMPEEQRWAKIGEDLGLDAWQATEIRRASDDLLADIRDFASRRETSGARAVDPETVRASFDRSRDRVGRVLSEEQLRKFDFEGYGEAVGLGRNPPDLGAAFTAPRETPEAR
jgi:hypothetical protein